jgi:cholesterol transport system auxiliary component
MKKTFAAAPCALSGRRLPISVLQPPGCRLAVAAVLLALTAACSSMLPARPEPPALFALESPAAATAAPDPATGAPASAATLIVYPTHAAAGFDSARIVYQREPLSRAAFAHSEWVDTPARMLTPLIVAGLQSQNGFRAVLTAPSAAAADLRLDTDIVRLQHEFGASPSRVRFTLRATLIDTATRRVLAARVFDETVPAQTDDAKGGVVAANAAVQAVLAQLGGFCAQAAQQKAVVSAAEGVASRPRAPHSVRAEPVEASSTGLQGSDKRR